MDYCSTCRRHLNGALVCPGCGAYAPGIAPLADGTPAPGAAAWHAPSHLWHDAEPGAEEFGEAPQEYPCNGPVSGTSSTDTSSATASPSNSSSPSGLCLLGLVCIS